MTLGFNYEKTRIETFPFMYVYIYVFTRHLSNPAFQDSHSSLAWSAYLMNLLHT